MTARTAIRLGIPTLILASTASAVAVSLHAEASAIPTLAFSSRAVLAVQLTLLFFYATLLLLVPLIRALSDGALPIELSLKGARWSEGVDDISGDVFDRLAEAKEEVTAGDLEIKEEVEELRILISNFRSGEAHRNQKLEG